MATLIVDATGATPGSFTTIQAAINAAGEGDTVSILAGTYNESLSLNKFVHLEGAEGVIVQGAGSGSGLAIGANASGSDGAPLTVSGITFQGFLYGLNLSNAHWIDLDGVTATGNTVGVKVPSTASVSNLNISNSHFDGNGQGWFDDKNAASGSSVTDVTFTNTTFNNNTIKGLYTEKMSNVVFDGVTVDGSGVDPAYQYNSGFDINLKYGDYDTITIRNSTFTGSGVDGSGPGTSLKVAARGYDGDGAYSSNPATLAAVVIENTTIDNGGANGLVVLNVTSVSTPESGIQGAIVVLGTAGDDVIDVPGAIAVDGGSGFDIVVVADRDAANALNVANVEAIRYDDAGGTVFVVKDGMSIQDAIDAASEGDTIIIEAGTYTENLVISTDGLTLIGEPGALLQGTFRSTNGIEGPMSEFFESTPAYNGNAGAGVTVNADGVTLQGLTITSFLTGVEVGASDGLTLDNVTLSDSAFGVNKAMDADVTNLTINGGLFTELYIGVLFAKSPTEGVGNVDGFVLDGATFFEITQKGVYAETLLNALMTNLSMTNVGEFGGGRPFGAEGKHGAGIDLNFKYETGLYENVVIDGFTFTNVGLSDGLGTPHGNAGAFTIKVRDDGSYADNPADFVGQVIIRNGSVDGTSVGVRAGEEGKTVAGPLVSIEGVSIDNAALGEFDNVTGSTLTIEGTAGDDVWEAAATTTGDLYIDGGDGNDTLTGGAGNDVLIGGAGDDVLNGGDGDDVIDAREGADTVDGGDGFDQVIVADAEAAAAFSGVNVELISYDNGSGTTFVVKEGMSIQAAIDAASDGDVITVEAGHFVEQLLVDGKAVTIQGAGEGLTFIDAPATASLQVSAYDGMSSRPYKYALVAATNDAHLTISGLTVDGLDHGKISPPTNGDFVGIFGLNASIDADSVTVTGIREVLTSGPNAGQPSGAQRNSAVIVTNYDDGARTFNFTNSTVENWQKNAFVIYGSGLVVNLTGNTINGEPISSNGQNGIQLSGGATGVIHGNTISGITYVPGTVGASSILLYDADGVVVTDNILTGGDALGDFGDYGIYMVDTDGAVITGNSFDGYDFAMVVHGDITVLPDVTANTFGDGVTNGVNYGFYPSSAADDTVVGTDGSDQLLGGGGDDVIFGGAGDDYIDGGAGNDVIDGGEGMDILFGGDGDDVIHTDGNDIIDGGAGHDIAWVADLATAQNLNLAGTSIEALAFDNGDGTTFLVKAGMSIQDAIDAASDGDTIMIEAGVYAENLQIGKALTLIGADGVVIQPATGDAIEIVGDLSGGDITFDNIDLVGGVGSQRGLDIHTGANVGELTFINGSISGFALFGIWASDNGDPIAGATVANLVVSDSDFANNGTGGANGAGHIKLFGFSGDASFTNLTLTGADSGSAVADRPDSGIDITGNVLSYANANPAPANPPTMGTVTINGVVVTGAYHKNPISVFHFSSIEGLSITGLDLSEAESDWGPLINFDGITSSVIDTSVFHIVFPDGPGVWTEIQGEKGSQGDDVDTTIIGTAGNDSLHGKSGDDALFGGEGDDVLYGGNKPGNEFDDGAGNDLLDGGAGDDILVGGVGDDTLLGGDGDDTLDGGDGQDILIGGEGNDVLDGGAGNDILVGGAGDDVLNGGDGDDIIDATQGADTVDGGAGFDSVIVADAEAAANFTGINVELISYQSDSGVTWVVKDGMSIQDAINAASAGDTIVIEAGVYTENLVIGTDGLTLIGQPGAVLEGTFRSENGIVGSTSEYFETAVAYSGAAGRGITVNADGVTLEGLTIRSFSTGVELGDGIDGLTLNDMTISDGVTGIRKGTTADVTNLTVNGGLFTELYHGMVFYKAEDDGVGNLDGFTVNGTTFFELTQKGIYAETLLNALVTDIIMTNVGEYGGGPAFGHNGAHGAGVDLNFKYETGLYQNIVFDGFTFTNVGKSNGLGTSHANAGAFTIKARDDGAYAGNPADFTGAVLIRNGLIDGSSVGVRAGEAGKTVVGPDVIIEGVTIHNVAYGDVENLTQSTMTIALTDEDTDFRITSGSSGVINVTGSSVGSTLMGSNSGDFLTGGVGDDTLFGGDGDDVLDGGAGADNLVGGAGNDTFIVDNVGDATVEANNQGVDTVRAYIDWTLGANIENLELMGSARVGTGNALNNVLFANPSGGVGGGGRAGIGGEGSTLYGLAGDDTLIGMDGDDLLYGGVGADVVSGGAGADLLDGGAGNDVLDGGDGDDTLIAGSGTDLLFGGAGDDLLIGGAGADMMFGGDGDDWVSYENSSARVVVRLNTNVGQGGDAAGDVYDSIENVVGSSHNDSLIGSAGANTLIGGDGDDYLNGLAGGDLLIGGEGIDTVSYANSDSRVIVRLKTGVGERGHAEGDMLIGVENLMGSKFNDTLIGDAAANTFTGGDGDDYLDGIEGDDVLYGEAGDDRIKGGAGDDYIVGGAGADQMEGGDGVDTLSYEGSNAKVAVRLKQGTVSGGHGNGDTFTGFENIVGSDHNDTLIGDDGANVIQGGLGDDYLDGLAGDDVLIGGDGADRMKGGDGDDLLEGGAGADQLDGGAGVDTLSYASSDAGVTVRFKTGAVSGGHADGDTITGFENLIGSDFKDTLIADDGDNRIEGGLGDDYLDGLGGNDVLVGGAGNDRLKGGLGDDLFIFDADSGHDQLMDFQAGAASGDRMQFEGGLFADFADLLAHTVDTANGAVISKDGMSVTVQGVTKAQLTADDFVFVGSGAGVTAAPMDLTGGGRSGEPFPLFPSDPWVPTDDSKADPVWSDVRIAPEVAADPVPLAGPLAPTVSGGRSQDSNPFGPEHQFYQTDWDWVF